jgi:hypothetical protein
MRVPHPHDSGVNVMAKTVGISEEKALKILCALNLACERWYDVGDERRDGRINLLLP